ncbi:uncharacterized protein TNCV_2467201 [Trichonephila clavipes]|nr:uncharacterized protein TNCV_2467201 [Trichonephila clavipes]
MFGLGNYAQRLCSGLDNLHVQTTYIDGYAQEQRPEKSVILSRGRLGISGSPIRVVANKHHYGIHILAESKERYAWLQQDSATCHTSHGSMKVLTEFFDDRIISKELWPPLLSDLSIQDFFLWRYLKNVTFRNNLHKLDERKNNIFPAISDNNSYTLRKVSINLAAVSAPFEDGKDAHPACAVSVTLLTDRPQTSEQ